jgi:glycerate kinase
MPAPPPLGIRLLVDVDNPLLGDRGAARIFGPQKGATPADVELLDRGLATWARLLPVDPATAGSGAAGGTAFGLLAWGAHIVPGGRAVADLLGIRAALLDADLVITGEGRFDAQSLGGKAPRIVLDLAAETGTAAFVIAGDTDAAASAWPAVTLTSLAGSTAAAVDDAERWLVRAGAAAAVRYSERGGGEPRPDGVARGEPRRRR